MSKLKGIVINFQKILFFNLRTISQLKWRFMNLINGEDYHLINVISDNKDDLIRKTDKLLSENIFVETD